MLRGGRLRGAFWWFFIGVGVVVVRWVVVI